MTAEQVAAQHQAEQAALAFTTAQAAADLWTQVDPAAVISSWATQLPVAVGVVTAGQTAAAQAAPGYMADLLDEYDLPDEADGHISPSALAGTASDGRDLVSLLMQPAISTVVALASGIASSRAMAAGRLSLDMIVRTQVADAGRAADGVELAGQRSLSGYVRVLSPPSCSRCAILAGRWYRWNQGFLRHPRCDCRHLPAAQPADVTRVNPRRYFNSLTAAEQDKTFGKAGAQAIRDGADIGQVVNARRGMHTAGGRRFTTSSTTRRGVTRGRPRLMPEQIYAEAGGDRDEAVRLLRLHGYLAGSPVSRRSLTLAASRPAPTDDLSLLTVVKLRALAKERGVRIPSGSRKADIVRLLSAPAPVDELARMTVVQLRALAKQRGIRVLSRDRKAEIVDKIRAGTPAAAVKTARAPARFSETPLTRRELAAIESRRKLEIERVRLTAAETELQRDVIRLRIADLEERINQTGTGKYNWSSPWWDEIGGIRVRGTPGAGRLAEHIEQAVSRRLTEPLRGEVLEALRRQSDRVPRALLNLRAITDPDTFDFDINGDALAYYLFGTRQISLHPHRFGSSTTARAEMESQWRRAQLAGWWARTDAPNPVGTILAHEFGHHVAFRALDGATYSQLVTLARAFDTGLGAGGEILREVRRTADFDIAVDGWLRRNRNIPISRYAATNHQELMAEVWQEFTTAATPRAHVAAMGQALLDLVEKMDIMDL